MGNAGGDSGSEEEGLASLDAHTSEAMCGAPDLVGLEVGQPPSRPWSIADEMGVSGTIRGQLPVLDCGLLQDRDVGVCVLP
jgi:hypothetical protein